MPAEFEFPRLLDLIAVMAWALSGAIVARYRNFDFMGVFIISAVSATGGGILRDVLVGTCRGSSSRDKPTAWWW